MEIGSKGVLDLSSHPEKSVCREGKEERNLCSGRGRKQDLCWIFVLHRLCKKTSHHKNAFQKSSLKQMSFMRETAGCKIDICRTPSPAALYVCIHITDFFGTKKTKTSDNEDSGSTMS